MKNYDHIELTEEEKQRAIDKALYEAKKQKAYKLELDEYNKQFNGVKEPLTYTAEVFHKLILYKAENRLKALGKKFTNDEWCKDIIWALALYFTNDPRFEKLDSNFSLNKGIAIMGHIGCGKTFVIDIFHDNQKQSFITVDTETCADDYKHKGEMYLQRYYAMIKPSFATNSFGHPEYGNLFDDLGNEDSKKHFGDELSVMAKILRERHKRNIFSATHITTNLTAKEIELRYGTRTRSRMREMFNVIRFNKNAPDRRK